MNRRDLLMISGIAVMLLAAVTGFDFVLTGVMGVPPAVETPAAAPSLTVASRSNVRVGDSTEFPIAGKLEVGEAATILGISSGSAGWYYIELSDGKRGFISPSIVTTDGDLTNLERIDPRSLSATATPLPTTVAPTQPPATAATDEAQPATPTASG